MAHEFSIKYATLLDSRDALRPFREQFHLPQVNGREAVYFLGNSLGLQPKSVRGALVKVMDEWASQGVEGFFTGSEPWVDYEKQLTRMLAAIVGAGQKEIVVMNHLTVNLHFLMISFYRPTAKRFKIICEAKAFPSDQYAFRSQVKLHGYDPDQAIIEVTPREGSSLVAHEDILAAIAEHGQSVALVLFSGVNYYTGQLFDIKAITAAAHETGAYAEFDLAHAAGNVQLNLHDWGVDFAAWCSYKYLNSGPGAIAAAFVHERHLANEQLPRLEGWWGNDFSNRFKMEPLFTPTHSAESWSNSTPPILLLAALKASLEIFESAGFNNLLAKARLMSEYLFFVLNHINTGQEKFTIITPTEQRGSQVSLSLHHNAKALFDSLMPQGIFADWREPNVIRIAPVPLYNSFEDIFFFAQTLHQLVNSPHEFTG